MPYILSLPVTRRGYAVEKYIFSILVAAASWVLAILLGVSSRALQKKSFIMSEDMLSMLVFVGIILIIISVSIPPQLKWGAEKGRLVMMVCAAIIFAAAVYLDKILRGDMATKLSDVLNSLPVFQSMAIFLIICLILTGISLALSIRIMETKEI